MWVGAKGLVRLAGALVALMLTAGIVRGQMACPEGAARNAAVGWSALADGDLEGASNAFRTALALCPGQAQAATGQGYVSLRVSELESAESWFRTALARDPDSPDALTGLALTHYRMGRTADAAAGFDRALAIDPNRRDAWMGLARARAALGDPQEAVSIYQALRTVEPGDREVLRGLARALLWAGDAEGSTRVWRSVVAQTPDDPEAAIGLSQALLEGGHGREAISLLEAAAHREPTHPRVLEQLDALRQSMAFRSEARFVYESDSDQNRVRSTVVTARWSPWPGLTLRWDGYGREAKVDRRYYRVRRAYGSTVGISSPLGQGFRGSVSLGGSESNVPGVGATGMVGLALETPRTESLIGTLSYDRAPLDATSPMIQNGLQVDRWSLTVRPRSSGRTLVALGTSGYLADSSNRRWNLEAAHEQTVNSLLSVGSRLLLYGFRESLGQGYFDPDLYGLWEVSGRLVLRPWSRLSLEALAAPGLQKVRSDGPTSGAVRFDTHLSFEPLEGRYVRAGLLYSTGLQGLTSEVDGYRYLALSLGGSWVF